jgi:hypothetical protein
LFFLLILYWWSLCILHVCSGALYTFLMIFSCLPIQKKKKKSFEQNFVLSCHWCLTAESCVCIFHVFWNCRWVDAPPCDGCGSKTISRGMGSPLSSEIQYGASRVELYLYDYRICLFLSSDFSVWQFLFLFHMWSNMSLHVYLIFVSLYSISNHIPKANGFRSGTGISYWVTMCFSFFVGVGGIPCPISLLGDFDVWCKSTTSDILMFIWLAYIC